MKLIVDFRNLSYAFPDTARPVFEHINWQIENGAFSLLTGPSGSGKSTLLRVMNGLVPHFSGGRFGGTATVVGLDVARNGPRALSQHVGFVFQDPEPQMIADRVDDEICFSLEQRGVSKSLMRRRLEELLDTLGISELRGRSPRSLSGGEQQRVAIAAALATYPDLLVLDEPTSQLDPAGADAVMDVLGRMHRDLGLTIVLSEHRLERLLDRVDLVTDLGPDGCFRVKGPPATIVHELAEVALPPVSRLARNLGWERLPLTIHQMRSAAGFEALPCTLADREPRIPSPTAVRETVRLDRVSVQRQGRHVLAGVDLTVGEGEFVAIMGRNGSGKTTLLRTVLGFEKPTSGAVRTGPATTMAYLPQQPSTIFFHETVAEEITWTLRQRNSAKPLESVLAEFGLSDKASTHPRDLSGGERERAALATMLAGSPNVIVLDEPTRGMDTAHKQLLMHALQIRQSAGATIILATHDVELVARYASRVVMLGAGEIVADGHSRQVLADSLSYAPQINRLFGGSWMTVDDVLEAISGRL